MSSISSAISYAGSFLKKPVSYAGSFLLEPVHAVISGFHALTWPCRSRCRRKFRPDQVRSIIPPEVIVQEPAAGKINKLITQLGLNHQNIVLCRRKNYSVSASINSSITESGYALLILDSELVDEIKTMFAPDNKFIIAHELGHVKADDMGVGLAKIEGASSVARIAIYTFAMMVSPLGLVGSHILGCTTAKLSGIVANLTYQRRKEFNADEFAASQSKELCREGISFFENQRKINLDFVQSIIQVEEKLRLPPCIARITTIFCSLLILRKGISQDGNLITDLEHPPFTERIANLKRIHKLLYENPVCVIRADLPRPAPGTVKETQAQRSLQRSDDTSTNRQFGARKGELVAKYNGMGRPANALPLPPLPPMSQRRAQASSSFANVSKRMPLPPLPPAPERKVKADAATKSSRNLPLPPLPPAVKREIRVSTLDAKLSRGLPPVPSVPETRRKRGEHVGKLIEKFQAI